MLSVSFFDCLYIRFGEYIGVSHASDSLKANRDERKCAVLRLILGQLQIIGATAGLYLLVKTGVSRETAIVVGITLLVSITSRIIFRSGRAPDPRGNVESRISTEQQNHYGNTHRH
jgi:hypothetical protein